MDTRSDNSSQRRLTDCGNPYLFQNHLALREQLTNGQVQCEECYKTFSRRVHLKAHQRSHHRNEKPFVCPICSKGFTRKASMEEHVARHKGLKDKECPVRITF